VTSEQPTGEMSWDEAWELQRTYHYARRSPPLPREEEGGYSRARSFLSLDLRLGTGRRRHVALSRVRRERATISEVGVRHLWSPAGYPGGGDR
jgi:hypothetical protein